MITEEMERFSDEGEVASRLEDMAREDSIRKARKAQAVPAHFDGIHCTECDEEIPAERLAIGAHTDIDCQRAIELRSRQHRSYYE